jgi:hypothetical protein
MQARNMRTDLSTQAAAVAGFSGLKARKNGLQMGRVLPGRHEQRPSVVQDNGSDGIALMKQQSGKTRGGPSRVFEFGDGRQTKLHRAAGVDRDDPVQVCFFFELLDEVAVVSSVHLPVDLPDLVTRCVLSMLSKLAATAFRGRRVFACEQTIDHRARQ